VIVGLGCIAQDRVLFTNASWEDGKGRITRTETRFGGNVRTALSAAAALGSPAAYLATVSSEPAWDGVLADLEQNDVSVSFTSRARGAHPALATIIVTGDGERFIAYDDSSLAHTPLPDRAIVDAALEQATVLLVDASTAPPGSLEVMSRALERSIPIVLDAEREVPGSAIVDAMIALADHPILPLSFARTVTGLSSPVEVIEALWQPNRGAVVITAGSQGAHVRSIDLPTVTQVPAFSVVALDTVGCGDVFHGAYGVGLDRGLGTLDRVRLANAAAAIVAATPSGHPRRPTPTAVDELVRGSGA
jgi:sugar/nucleoside kinase (ribokinase family)